MRSFEEWCEWDGKGPTGTVEDDTCELETGEEITREEFDRDWTDHVTTSEGSDSVTVDFYQFDPDRIGEMIDSGKIEHSEIDSGDAERATLSSYIAGLKMYGVNHSSGLAHPSSINDESDPVGVEQYEDAESFAEERMERTGLHKEAACHVGTWSYTFGVDSDGDVHPLGVGDICEADKDIDGTVGIMWVDEEITVFGEDIPELSGDIHASSIGEYSAHDGWY